MTNKELIEALERCAVPVRCLIPKREGRFDSFESIPVDVRAYIAGLKSLYPETERHVCLRVSGRFAYLKGVDSD